MVEKVTDGNALPQEIIQQIVIKTDGVPLFIEELTKSVVESVGVQHAAPTFSLGIPSTLQDALMARLDRLGAAKEIAQLGATLGREFDYALLQTVSPLPEEALQQGLQQLVDSELVFQSGMLPQARYLFKHALVQDTAYQSLLKSRRQQLHQQVAQILVEQFPQMVETQPELIAHHYTEAGLIEQAIPYWQQAGQKAAQRSAYVEAISHLTKGLALLKALPVSPERVQQELTLQLIVYDALVTIKGYTAVDVENTVTRARELCQQIGETLQLFPVLWRLLLFYMNRGELQTTLELAKQMLRLAQSVQDRYLLSVAHMSLGKTLYLLGELTSARPHLEQAIVLYNPQTHPRPTVNTADPRMDCNSYLAWTLWHLGYPEQALKRSQEAVALAAELSHPFSLAYALGLAAWFHACRRDGQLARDRAEAVITLSTEQGFPYWLSLGTMVRGWTLAEQGQMEEGIAQMHQSQPVQKVYLPPLAEVYGKVGKAEAGLSLVAELLVYVDKTGTRVNEAELYRLKGQLTLQSKVSRSRRVGNAHQHVSIAEAVPVGRAHPTQESDAEACFLKAIEVARKQQAKSLELRASTSLARLWQQQGNRAEAHKLLSDVYNWFTEGFDTKDLQEAKMLIEELID
jgi:predicted ATPase